MESTSHPSYLKTQETVSRSSKNYKPMLHSTKKESAKPWKRPVTASLERMRPQVYRVEPVNFKELVQRLTGGAQDHEPEEHQCQVEIKKLMCSADETKATQNPFAFDLSPSSSSSHFWEAFPLLSAANLSRW